MPKRDRIRHKIITAGVLLIILGIWFSPLFQGKRYGLLSHEQKRVFLPEELRALQSQIAAHRWSHHQININPDYILLQIPTQYALNQAIKEGTLPLFDPTRLLGIPLLGHPLTGPFNPLNYVFAGFEADVSILLKGFTYLGVGLVGFLLLMDAVGLKNRWYGIAGALCFLLSPNTLHYFHWANYLGIVCLFPWVLLGLVALYREKWIKGMLILGISNAGMIIVNMNELYFYALLSASIFGVILFGSASLQRQPLAWKQVIFGLISASVIAVLLALPQIVTVADYSSHIARKAHPIAHALIREPYLPVNQFGWAGIFGFPLEPLRMNQHMPFFTVTFLFLVGFALSKWRFMTPPILAIAGLFVFLIVLTFIGYLDLPLMLFPAYRLLSNQMRMLHYLYATAGILLVFGLQQIQLVARKKISNKKIILYPLIGQILALAYFGLRAWLHFGMFRNVMFNPWFLLMLVSICLQPLLIWCVCSSRSLIKITTILGILLIAVPFLCIGKIMLSFDDPSDTLKHFNYRHELLPTRALVIDPRINTSSPMSLRLYSGSIFWSVGEVSLTGYDTGLREDEKLLFRQFWPEGALQELIGNRNYSWMHFPDYWVIPGPEKLMEVKDNSYYVPTAVLDKLKLLGVNRIYTSYHLHGLKQQGAFYRFSVYEINEGSPVTFIEDGVASEISEFLYSTDMLNGLNKKMERIDVSHIQPFKGGWRIHLPLKEGVLVVPFAFGDYFTYLIDSKPVTFLNSKRRNGPVLLLGIDTHMSKLDIIPHLTTVFRLLWGGLFAAAVMVCFVCIIGRRGHFIKSGFNEEGRKDSMEHKWQEA